MNTTRLVVAGASGRMGRALVRAAHATEGIDLVGATEREGAATLGADAGELAGLGPLGVTLVADIGAALAGADVVVDFTAPAASVALAATAADHGVAHVIGTTGFSAEDEASIVRSAGQTAIVKSGNMSLGVNLLAVLVERAAASLGPDLFDIEVLEMHHRHKVDAPSGTALLLGEAAARGRRVALDEASVRVRDGHTGPRPEGSIGFATLRGGSVVGEHHVILAGDGERIELTHRAEDRSLFARGAIRAVAWAKGRPPGLYSMRDVLGL